MTIIDRGHLYSLQTLDGSIESLLQFVKREGANFPGNIGSYPGTTLQEVLRACINRVQYLDAQISDLSNKEVLFYLREAIFHLEERAARRHGRIAPTRDNAVNGPCCKRCLHAGCDESRH